ncbi:UDP-N-acetylmuramoyl-tripeptide--D-alanyl-D-alanine ligase [Jannaschia rubra]|uniref:UDP-N-acetylmuramoyl-tripeptide--D-alanyl-D-alanine ligase n=1 Tax=Jannaschia rubra TaxID=282197 RepID=A0A0M6XPG7_9RHOB|nr:UDP-N-acetylmuramoyl-tripeptide--D-alanyl-D-alanine ligase [Jannaschia rubra]CTQ32015.1 UDP-N-acetylmuramoyl-tripeptide--D-alanyl-D-alanine ligase [Jannaschia rubra]SFG39804.1 UDP-N-acetylmuramoyl-tripeptide--D-alanyl-D-alanine ligase [Jannaschia rubra]
MTLWSASDAAAAMGGRAQGDWSVTGLGIDSRAIGAGQMFVALRAARDGHDFVRAALDAGAGAALVDHVPEGCADAPLLIVDDVQTALEALGRAGRARTTARVIAVTGSVGKTSTKEMLRHVLSAQGPTHAAIKSYNNHWGVPLTLAAIPPDAAFAVVEIGMNHPGEIAPLAAQAAPDVAMVTTVAAVHLEAFPDGLPGIAREKAAIFGGLRPGGTAIWNADLDVSDILAERGTLSFGQGAGADWRLTGAVPGDGCTVCSAETPMGPIMFRVGAPGAHFAMNALAVLAAVHAAGGDVGRAALALGGWSPPEGRGRRQAVTLDPDRAPVDLIDDAYNANPASVGAALDLLAATTVPRRARRIAVLGDMKELGPTAPDLHRALAAHPAMEAIDTVHTVGPLARALHDALPADRRGHHAEDAPAMTPHLRHMVRPGDAVLVKGSLSMKMATLVEGLRALGTNGRTE